MPIPQSLSIKELEILAHNGDEYAQYTIGHYYEFAASINKEQKEENIKRAMPYYHAAAEKGHPEAALRYGLGCERGHSRKKDKDKAFFYYSKAAKQKNIRAIYELGQCFESGIGTAKDIAIAIKHYELVIKLIKDMIEKIQIGKLSLTEPHAPDLNEINKVYDKAKDKVLKLNQGPSRLGKSPLYLKKTRGGK